MIVRRWFPALGLLGLLGCAARTPGAQPHEASVAQHELNAATEERAEGAHFASDDARAAEFHRKRAAEHRAASQALRDAEARACVGIAESDRDRSPFDHRENVASVEPLYVMDRGAVDVSGSGPAQPPRGTRHLAGAVVMLRAAPGMTAEWLQRVVDCHLARNAALGHEVPEMPYCPLVPNGAEATVTPARGGFAVTIQSDVPASAEEVLRRSRGLLAAPLP